MENVFKITRKILALAIFFIGFQYGTAQSDFFVYKVSGEPYIEVNDSIKSVTKGSVLNKDTFLTMNRIDIVLFLDEKGVKIIQQKNGGYKIQILARRTSDQEKCRVNVTTQIKRGMKNIEEKMPSLYQHLKDRIKTDGSCRYEIDSNDLIPWSLKWNK